MDRTSCCSCTSSSRRCGTVGLEAAGCECRAAGKICFDDCETVHLGADCLNQAPVACRCSPMVVVDSIDGAAASTKRGSSAKRKDLSKLSAASLQPCRAAQCECRVYGEPCTDLCRCLRSCRQSTAPIVATMKTERPAKGCKCGGGSKKSCIKTAKCPCRAAMQHCQLQCKCQRDCCNSLTKSVLTKIGRTLFAEPEQDPSAVVLCLTGANNYKFRMEFLDNEKTGEHALETLCQHLLHAIETCQFSDLIHICVFATKSPCFHQDCEPKCEILQECNGQRACAKRLAVAFTQIKRQLGTVDLAMTVKFLSPYVKRGDLFLQQGLLCMLKAGIIIEPLVMREWIELMHETPEDASTLAKDWLRSGMDSHVGQAQKYINACRQAVGLNDIYWSGSFHDALKVTALTCEQTYRRLTDLSARFTKSASIKEGCASLRASKSLIGLAEQSGSMRARKKSGVKNQSEMFMSLDLRLPDDDDALFLLENAVRAANDAIVATAGHRPAAKPKQRVRADSEKESKRPSSNPPIARHESVDAVPDATSTSKSNQDSGVETTMIGGMSNSSPTTAGMEEWTMTETMPRQVDIGRVVLGLSGRAMDSTERQHIRAYVLEAVDNLREGLHSLLGYLDALSVDNAV